MSNRQRGMRPTQADRARAEQLRYGGLSLWLEGVADDLATRLPLAALEPGRRYVDVAIVGGGYTGLWTALYLKQANPSLRIAVLEAETAGFGASGRNGGWCSALYPVGLAALAAESGRGPAVAQYRAMIDTLDEIESALDRYSIDADWHRGGTVTLARTPLQLDRAREEVGEAHHFGFTTDDVRLLDADSARGRLAATDVVGAMYTPHCARVQPAKLARGLAHAVEGLGVEIYERTPVTRIDPGLVHTDFGPLRADVIVRATEGFTPRLQGLRRAMTPVYSLIIATEPLSQAVWDEIGLADRETFSDFRHLIIYGQRTADDRMVFGGRGAPYHFGSAIKPEFDNDRKVFDALQSTLGELFPRLADVRITHRWGGPLGIARDWHASVDYDATTGLASAGGYVGDGVSTTNLAGRTLADLITGRDTDLTRLPWVNHHSRDWEPEPLRWLGANAALSAMTWADRTETRTGRPSKAATAVNALLGR